MTNRKKSLNGIGGWLLIFFIRLSFGILGEVSTLAQLIISNSDGRLIVEIAIYGFTSICFILCLVKLMKRKGSFRVYYVMAATIEAIAMIPDATRVIAIILAEGIWISYIYCSKRVKVVCEEIEDPYSERDATGNKTLNNLL